MRERSKGILPITSDKMTRFSITLQESIDLVLYAIENGGWGDNSSDCPIIQINRCAEAIAPELKSV